MAKLFTIQYKLSMGETKPYEQTYTALFPAESDVQARERFLTEINKEHILNIEGTMWPVFYTRVIITGCFLAKANLDINLPVPKDWAEPIPVKKERKKRQAKEKPAQQGIKPKGRGRPKKS
jgi:hypothetical protein